MHLLATAALWVRIQTSPKTTKGRHTLARQKNIQKILEQDDRQGCVISTSYQGKNVIILIYWRSTEKIRLFGRKPIVLKNWRKTSPYSDAQTSMGDNKYLLRRYNTHYRNDKMQYNNIKLCISFMWHFPACKLLGCARFHKFFPKRDSVARFWHQVFVSPRADLKVINSWLHEEKEEITKPHTKWGRAPII